MGGSAAEGPEPTSSMLRLVTGAVGTGILRPLLTVTDIIQFVISFLLALLPAAYIVITKGTKPLTRMDQLYNFLVKFPFGGTLFSLMVGIASPYNASIRPRFLKLEKDVCQASIQDRPWLRNPFSSIHAMALGNLAEMVSGVGMLTAAQYVKGCRVIVVKVEIDYHKKARGQVIATANCIIPEDRKDAVIPYTVLVHDKKGELVATCVAHWKISFKDSAKDK